MGNPRRPRDLLSKLWQNFSLRQNDSDSPLPKLPRSLWVTAMAGQGVLIPEHRKHKWEKVPGYSDGGDLKWWRPASNFPKMKLGTKLDLLFVVKIRKSHSGAALELVFDNIGQLPCMRVDGDFYVDYGYRAHFEDVMDILLKRHRPATPGHYTRSYSISLV